MKNTAFSSVLVLLLIPTTSFAQLVCEQYIDEIGLVEGFITINGKPHKVLTELQAKEVAKRLSELESEKSKVILLEQKIQNLEDQKQLRDETIKFYASRFNECMSTPTKPTSIMDNPSLNFMIGFAASTAAYGIYQATR